MKAKFASLMLITLLIEGISCKKNDLNSNVETYSNASLKAASASATRYVVSTIAGSPYQSGPTLVDGTGTNVRFLFPNGIQLSDDGNIYIADGNDGVIRKLLPGGQVTTIRLPKAPDGEEMLAPAYVGVAKDGTINVITGNNLNSDYPEAWIFEPGKPAFVHTDFYATYQTLAKDPYEDVFWFTEGFSALKFKKSSSGFLIGTDQISFNIDSIFSDPSPHSSFSAIAIGNNKVKYLSDGHYLYKYTPGGKSERIFEELGVEGFTTITCIVSNKDCRTLYIADAGYIRRIDDGKLTTIAGPSSVHDNRDGTGRQADVHARYLALSRDEGILYFSDSQAKTIRKILLR